MSPALFTIGLAAIGAYLDAHGREGAAWWFYFSAVLMVAITFITAAVG